MGSIINEALESCPGAQQAGQSLALTGLRCGLEPDEDLRGSLRSWGGTAPALGRGCGEGCIARCPGRGKEREARLGPGECAWTLWATPRPHGPGRAQRVRERGAEPVSFLESPAPKTLGRLGTHPHGSTRS